MLNDTHETAPNRSVQAGDVQFAYRRFGPRGAAPLLLLNYFAAHMDDWDPKITNGFAEEHDVILVDYPGIGKSSGQTPSNVAALTNACFAFCRGLTQFDVVGFSLGGMIAQQLGAEHPDLLRRIMLLGTGPRGGEGLVFDDLSVDELDDPSALLRKAFFTQSDASQASWLAYMERLKSRRADRDTPVSRQSASAELAAIRLTDTILGNDNHDLTETLKVIASEIGLSHISYVRLPHEKSTDLCLLAAVVTYSRVWQQRYFLKKYVTIDPVIPYGRGTAQPFDWANLPVDDPATKAFFTDALNHGVGRNGLSIPLRGHRVFALVSLTSDLPQDEWEHYKAANIKGLIY